MQIYNLKFILENFQFHYSFINKIVHLFIIRKITQNTNYYKQKLKKSLFLKAC